MRSPSRQTTPEATQVPSAVRHSDRESFQGSHAYVKWQPIYLITNIMQAYQQQHLLRLFIQVLSIFHLVAWKQHLKRVCKCLQLWLCLSWKGRRTEWMNTVWEVLIPLPQHLREKVQTKSLMMYCTTQSRRDLLKNKN